MTGVGIAVIEFATFFDQHFGDAITDQYAAKRNITRGHAFGKGDQIGFEAHGFAAEPCTEATEAANHFVRNNQHAVFIANALDFRPVGFRWNDDAARALHRFADKGGHFVRPDFEDFFFEPAGSDDAEFVFGYAQFHAVFTVVRLFNVDDTGNRQIALFVHAGHTAERRAGDGRAVVGIFTADDGFALFLPFDVPVAAHHTQIGVVRFRARAAVKHVIKAFGCNLRQ